MTALIEIKDVDRRFYETRLREFLPERIIDIHTHIWVGERPDRSLPKTADGRDPAGRLVTWPSRVAADNPVEDLFETFRLMLPGKQVTPLVFNNPTVKAPFDELNGYVSDCAARHRLPWLIMSTPEWSGAELARQLDKWPTSLGVKVYLGYAAKHIRPDDITIFDFITREQLAVLDQRGKILMLHIPRSGRLKDPVNLEQMLEIENRFPNVKLIIAHVGRAYCEEDIGNAFDVLKATQRMLFDFSANTNAVVFRRLIETVGPQRILFGTDMPILRMRMHRICENGRYVNLVPKGLYGDVSSDPNMREVEGEEAARLTFFLYEEIDAFRIAAGEAGLSRKDVEAVFHDNGQRLIASAR